MPSLEGGEKEGFICGSALTNSHQVQIIKMIICQELPQTATNLQTVVALHRRAARNVQYTRHCVPIRSLTRISLHSWNKLELNRIFSHNSAQCLIQQDKTERLSTPAHTYEVRNEEPFADPCYYSDGSQNLLARISHDIFLLLIFFHILINSIKSIHT